MKHAFASLALSALCLPALAACAATTQPPFDEDGNPRVREETAMCNADAAQDMIGERATQEVGTRLLEMTGARTLRWVPPDTAVTMDYRPDRLTVTYDGDYMIERITCG